MKAAHGLWVSSGSDEHWDCEVAYLTRHEASESAREDHDLMPDQPYYTGKLQRLTINTVRLFNSDYILDEVEEKVAEEFGADAVQDFLGKKVTGPMEVELDNMLQDAFMAWIHKHDLDLKYWQIDDVVQHAGENDGTVADPYLGAVGTGPVDHEGDGEKPRDPGEIQP